ncbi:MAG: helix-hairpin-helix domain-containing protein [Pseudomonadota bacterium]
MNFPAPKFGVWPGRVLLFAAWLLIAGGWWGRWWAEPGPAGACFNPAAAWVEVVAPDGALVLTELEEQTSAGPATKVPAQLSQAGWVALGRKMDLNLASAEELQFLPGVGPAMSARIVSDRSRRGPFSSLQDLKRVRGVGESLCSKIKPWAHAGTD